MWTLTPDCLSQVKNELKGRRDAIEARYAQELRAIDTDLEEIATLERIAYSISAKHLPGVDDVSSKSEAGAHPSSRAEPDAATQISESRPPEPMPVSLKPETVEIQEAVSEAISAVLPNPVAQLQPSQVELPASAGSPPKAGLSRWRIRFPSDGEVA